MGHVHNALDRATELVRGFRRAVGLTGPEGGVERFGETLTPVMDIWSQPIWATLRGDWLQWGRANVAAGGAGTRSIVRLRPVANSGRLLVVVHFIDCGEPFNIQNGLAVDLPTAQSIGQRDTRNPGDNRVVLTSDNTAAAAGTNRFTVHATPFRYQGPPIVCHTDGDGTNSGAVSIQATTDNSALDVAIAWSIHEAFPGENRFA